MWWWEGAEAVRPSAIAHNGWCIHIKPEAIELNLSVEVEESLLPSNLSLGMEPVQENSAVRHSLGVENTTSISSVWSMCDQSLTSKCNIEVVDWVVIRESWIHLDDETLIVLFHIFDKFAKTAESGLIDGERSEIVHVVTLDPEGLKWDASIGVSFHHRFHL